VTASTEQRLVCVLLICVLLFATTAGCYTVDPDYRAFYFSGKYQDWLEAGGGMGGTVLNPLWILGLPILVFDVALLPFMLIYDFCLWAFGSKERKAPWEWDPFRPKWAKQPSPAYEPADGTR
jgi:hypothetical protein